MLHKVVMIKGSSKWESVCNQNKIDEMIEQGYHVESIQPNGQAPKANLPLEKVKNGSI